MGDVVTSILVVLVGFDSEAEDADVDVELTELLPSVDRVGVVVVFAFWGDVFSFPHPHSKISSARRQQIILFTGFSFVFTDSLILLEFSSVVQPLGRMCRTVLRNRIGFHYAIPVRWPVGD